MKDFDALKDIWSNQSERSKVSPEDILKRVKKSGHFLAKNLLLEVILMIAALFVLSYVWFTMPFRMWTSHLAIIIFIICCIYVMFAQFRYYRKIIDSSTLLDKPGDYIVCLKSYKRDRYRLNTKKYSIYTFLFSIGFALLFIEIFFTAELWVTITGFAFTIIWLLFCYFVLMKNYIRKEESRLEDMISNLERVARQFTNDTASS